MQATLEDFFKALRGSDLEVHLNAQVDAARAVELVGWSDRTLLKNALGTTLAKTTADRVLFDEAFDRFFRFDAFQKPMGSASGAPGAGQATSQDADQTKPDQPKDAQPQMGSGGPGGCQGSGGQALSQLLLSGDSAALAKRMQEAARAGAQQAFVHGGRSQLAWLVVVAHVCCSVMFRFRRRGS